jgi:plastocyanin
MRGRMPMLAALLAVVALLGAACGGDTPGDDDGTTGAPTTDGGDGGAQPLAALDNEFNPADVTVESGGTIDFTNMGENEHNFSVTDQDISEDVEPGGSSTITIDLDAGTYEFFCEYHEAAGMTGNLTVL